ncbi:MAG TPA: PEGA domain-containing protein [Kofleriaceae bacterium]|nr:PEGA domain-containing protein [Kofleriaceae bacterium]
MTKAIWGLALGLGIVLSLRTAHAQAPQPETPPKPEKTPKSDEKADTTETLQKGGDVRPWAQGVPPAEQKTALLAFREGNSQLNDGLFAKASETYRGALTHWKHPAIYYNLSLALMNLDQPVEAYESMQAATTFGEGPIDKDKFEHAKEYLLLLGKQIATITVACDKPGAKVSLDGKEVFIAPGKHTQRVRIGRHTLVAEKTGYQARVNAPNIGPGETFSVELKLFTADELTRYRRRWETTWMPYAVLGAGIGVGLIGVGLELGADSSYNDYDKKVAACSMGNTGCENTQALKDLRSRGDTMKTLGYVSYGVAGATIAGGIVLAILNRPKSYLLRPEEVQDQLDQKVTFAPIVTPTMAGASVQGHF